jgi:hypothetical protein
VGHVFAGRVYENRFSVLGLLVSFPNLQRAVQGGFGDFEGLANFRNWVPLLVEFLCNTALFAG